VTIAGYADQSRGGDTTVYGERVWPQPACTTAPRIVTAPKHVVIRCLIARVLPSEDEAARWRVTFEPHTTPRRAPPSMRISRGPRFVVQHHAGESLNPVEPQRLN